MEKTLTFDDFEAKFKPVQNQFNEDASYSGTSFDYSEEEEMNFVISQNPYNIWTLVYAVDSWYVVPGFRWIDREAYFVTENPFTEEDLHTEYLAH